MRRLSNRVAGLGSGARRQSSAHPTSRDGSIGPGIIRARLRSNSNSSAFVPPPDTTVFCDSDDETCNNEKDETAFAYGYDASVVRDSQFGMNTSVPGSSSLSTLSAGPVIPLSLLRGTLVWKLSKKRSPKLIFLVLDSDNAKIYWDKTRPSKSVYLDDIEGIRTGDDLSQYRRDFNAPEMYESRGFSLIIAPPDRSKNNRMMHLVADDEATLELWTTTIEAISKHRQDFATSLMAFNDKAVRAYWQSEVSKLFGDHPHRPEEESIDFSGVERVCRNLHIHVSSSTLFEKFNEVKVANKMGKDESRLNFAEFLDFVRLMKTRKDALPIYREYASDTELGLSRSDFLNFLRDSQGENVDEDLQAWEAVFARFARKGRSREGEPSAKGTEETLRMSEVGLASFLTSTSNVPLPREPRNYVLDRPLNEYYISSSHNTYLLGRQVAGVSSVEGYISALMRACRSVEVDCWDGQNNEPIVSHGHTLTTQISFREVINTINKYAFVTSSFPLFISLEVRCSLATQESMARIMLDTFGEKLVLQPIDPGSDRLPSPSQLQGRILIKVKKPQQADDPRGMDILGRRRGNSLTSPLQRPLTLDNGSVPVSPLLSPIGGSSRKLSTKINTISEVPSAPSSNPSECDSDSDKDSTSRTLNKINPILGNMGVYSAGIHFDGFDTPEAKTYNHIFSFKEKTFAKNSQPGDKKRSIFRHNMRCMMRVYPNGSRINSSNFDPLIYWKRGVQMAALNWQTFDLGMQLNRAMFASGTDLSGYVLKPIEFREFQVMPNGAGDWATKRERKNVSFSIDVISVQQLMRPYNLGEKRTLDPYVEVEVFLADDKRNKVDNSGNNIQTQGPLKYQYRYRTKIVRGNGFNPEFDNRFNFNVMTKYPDLVFVRWSVKLADKTYNDRTPPLATFTAKLVSLKQGYRTLPLLDHKGDQYLFSTLFCRIKVDITSVLVPVPGADSESANKFRAISRPSFFTRSNQSPKSSIDSGQS